MINSARMKWLVPLVAGGVALALVTAACGGGDEAESTEASEHMDDSDMQMGSDMHEEGVAASDVPAGAQMFSVVGTEFAFEPAEITVEAGRSVAVTLVNAGAVEHDWELATESGVEVEGAHAHAMPGAEAVAVFTLEPGTYPVICTLPGHEEAGMVGQVVAE